MVRHRASAEAALERKVSAALLLTLVQLLRSQRSADTVVCTERDGHNRLHG